MNDLHNRESVLGTFEAVDAPALIRARIRAVPVRERVTQTQGFSCDARSGKGRTPSIRMARSMQLDIVARETADTVGLEAAGGFPPCDQTRPYAV